MRNITRLKTIAQRKINNKIFTIEIECPALVVNCRPETCKEFELTKLEFNSFPQKKHFFASESISCPQNGHFKNPITALRENHNFNRI